MHLFGGYNATKLKPQLKMAVTRFGIASNKKSALMKQQIREIAKLLAEDPPKEEKARIKAEALIRDDNTVEAYEILQLHCELLAERLNLITHSKSCPADMLSTVATVIWASAIVDIPELIEVRKQFRYKYGEDFDEAAMQNVGGILNERVTSKLSVQPPSAYLVQTYLEKISDEHEVDWKPKVSLKAKDISQPMAAPTGYSVPEGAASGLNKKNYEVGTAAAALAPVPALPIHATAPSAPSKIGESKDDDDNIEEVDIYVPAAPKSQPRGGGSSNNNKKTQSAGECSKGNDEEDDDGETGGGNESYDDLLRRFARLNE